MAEPQVTAVTTPGGVITPVDGWEVEVADFQTLGQIAGLADDRVFAELLRMNPADPTGTYRGVLPYRVNTASNTWTEGAPLSATVVSSGSASGSVLINPFRAFIGSRTNSNGQQQWRDIRSGLFPGPTSPGLSGQGGGGVAPGTNQVLAPNSSGYPRWDLVSAVLTIDAAANPVSRRIKDANSGSMSVQTVYEYLASSVAISVTTGTPASPPTLPSLPSDSSGTYYVPLAYVLVPNGFTSTSTVLATNIRDASMPLSLSESTGVVRARPADGNNDIGGTYGTAWSMSGIARPGCFLPPCWEGGTTVFVAQDDTGGTPTFANGAVVDQSMNWCRRTLIIFSFGGITTPVNQPFAWDANGASGTNAVPILGQVPYISAANTFVADGSVVSGKSSVLLLGPSQFGGMASGSQVGLYVNPADGKLYAYKNAVTSGMRFFFMIMASGQFPNYVGSATPV